MQSTVNLPLISVVTVVYNQVDQLEQTILSVLEQEYDNVEYIIIDGGSTDGTTDVIKKYQERIAYWRSEPDKGIYDAMNKGIDVASGKWINFMNSGDRFAPNAIANVFNKSYEDAEILYGDAIVQYAGFKTLFKVRPLDEMWKAMPFCHQATFVRTEVMRAYRFDMNFRFSADFDFLLRVRKNNHVFRRVDQVICIFDLRDGASKSNAIQSVRERRRASILYKDTLRKRVYFTFHLLYIRLAIFVKNLIGDKATTWITRFLRA